MNPKCRTFGPGSAGVTVPVMGSYTTRIRFTFGSPNTLPGEIIASPGGSHAVVVTVTV